VAFATLTVGQRLDNVPPVEGHPLAAGTTLDYDTLGMPTANFAELHLFDLVVLRDPFDKLHYFFSSFCCL